NTALVDAPVKADGVQVQSTVLVPVAVPSAPESFFQENVNVPPLGAEELVPSMVTELLTRTDWFGPGLATGRSSARSRVLSARNSFEVMLPSALPAGTCALVTSAPPLAVPNGAAAR